MQGGPFIPPGAAAAAVTWAGDLVNSGNAAQYVSALSFDATGAAGAGGDIAIQGTATRLLWARTAAPVMAQTQQVNGSNPVDMFFRPQAPGAGAATAATGTPGNFVVDLAAEVSTGVTPGLVVKRAGTRNWTFGNGSSFGMGSGRCVIWGGSAAPATSNWVLSTDGSGLYLQSPTSDIFLQPAANPRGRISANGWQLFSSSLSFGGGVNVLGMTDASTAPTSNPAGGVAVYSKAGVLSSRGSGGAITDVAPVGSGTINSQVATENTVMAFGRTTTSGQQLTVYTFPMPAAPSMSLLTARVLARDVTTHAAGSDAVATWAAAFANVAGTAAPIGALQAVMAQQGSANAGAPVFTAVGATVQVAVLQAGGTDTYDWTVWLDITSN
jgi:hypothetical protein